jgi:hypothetical protein
VRVLMGLVRSGRLKGSPSVVLRPSPADEGSRYDQVRREYPELLYSPPIWVHSEQGAWDRVLPLPEDTALLANLTHHCDVNVNLASTMTLDFGIHDRPVVNIAFDVRHPPVFGVPLWEHFYRFEHYRPVVEFGAARFARSSQELAEHINAYLENPALDRAGRRQLVELEVAEPLENASRRTLDVLHRIAV